jgi:negative regulator of flagellin synthesis FlgM
MKIDGSTSASPLTGTSSSGAPARGAKAASQSRASSAGQDNVTLSSTSSQIKALESGIAGASGFDAAKVGAIKQAISEGRFTINPELIADKLIASAKELVSQRRG